MGTTTPNIGIYIPAAGETNYDAAFAAGMINIDQHDHSGSPTGGVPIANSGISDGAVTFNKLAANVADNATGIGTNGALGANQLAMLGLLKSLFQIGGGFNGLLVKNGTAALARTITGTANQIAVTNGDGIAANPILSLPANTTNALQSSFLGNAGAQAGVTGDGTVYGAIFAAGGANTFNRGGNFNGSATYTAPVTGVYMVHAELSLDGLDATNTTGEIIIRVNGNPTYTDFNGNIGAVRNFGNGFIISINQIMLLTAADNINIALQISGGAGLNVNIADGTFAAVLLS